MTGNRVIDGRFRRLSAVVMNIYGLEDVKYEIARREKAIKKYILFEDLDTDKLIERMNLEDEKFIEELKKDPDIIIEEQESEESFDEEERENGNSDKVIKSFVLGVVKLKKCRISNVTFRECKFNICDFELCEFSNVKFVKCSFFHDDPIDYKNTNDIAATNCYFYENLFSRVVFEECDFQYSIFVDNKFELVEFFKCQMFRQITYGGNYENCKIKQSHLNATFFYNSRMFQIDFSDNSINEQTVFHCSKWAGCFYIIDKFNASNEVKEKLPKESKKRRPYDYRNRYLTFSQISRMFQEQGFNGLAWEYYYIAKKNEKYSMSGFSRVISFFTDILCGYGERPSYTFLFILGNILLFGLAYLIFGFAVNDTFFSMSAVQAAWPNIIEVFKLYCHSVFFSITTFSTVGYGNYVPVGPISSTLAAIQMLMGVSLTALWTGCILRKISR